jgi:hypothetical protein
MSGRASGVVVRSLEMGRLLRGQGNNGEIGKSTFSPVCKLDMCGFLRRAESFKELDSVGT